MQVYVTLNLTVDDEFTMTSEEAATAVLATLGGDPAKDTCTVQATIPAAVVGAAASTPGPGDVTISSTFSTVNSAPPNTGQTRTDAAASSAATAVYVDGGAAQLLALQAGDGLEIRSVANTTRWMLFTLTDVPLDQGGYVELPVTFVETGGDPGNGACTLTFPARTA